MRKPHANWNATDRSTLKWQTPIPDEAAVSSKNLSIGHLDGSINEVRVDNGSLTTAGNFLIGCEVNGSLRIGTKGVVTGDRVGRFGTNRRGRCFEPVAIWATPSPEVHEFEACRRTPRALHQRILPILRILSSDGDTGPHQISKLAELTAIPTNAIYVN